MLPDNKTIITRAWKKSEKGNKSRSMKLFILNEDGSNSKQISFEASIRWVLTSSPDGVHVIYVRLLPPHNFELFLLNLKTLEE
jgi:Tol biopolymer transport system component